MLSFARETPQVGLRRGSNVDQSVTASVVETRDRLAGWRLRELDTQVVQGAALRAFGTLLLAALIPLHNFLLLDASYSVLHLQNAALVVLLYSLVSWLLLHRLELRAGKVELGHILLSADVFILILPTIYFTGGDKSWLFPLLLVRVADQAHTNFRRVLFYAHLTVFAYLCLLLHLVVVEQRVVAWPSEIG